MAFLEVNQADWNVDQAGGGVGAVPGRLQAGDVVILVVALELGRTLNGTEPSEGRYPCIDDAMWH